MNKDRAARDGAGDEGSSRGGDGRGRRRAGRLVRDRVSDSVDYRVEVEGCPSRPSVRDVHRNVNYASDDSLLTVRRRDDALEALVLLLPALGVAVPTVPAQLERLSLPRHRESQRERSLLLRCQPGKEAAVLLLLLALRETESSSRAGENLSLLELELATGRGRGVALSADADRVTFAVDDVVESDVAEGGDWEVVEGFGGGEVERVGGIGG